MHWWLAAAFDCRGISSASLMCNGGGGGFLGAFDCGLTGSAIHLRAAMASNGGVDLQGECGGSSLLCWEAIEPTWHWLPVSARLVSARRQANAIASCCTGFASAARECEAASQCDSEPLLHWLRIASS